MEADSQPGDLELVANLDWIQRLALALTRDRDAADDVTQEVARVWLERRPGLPNGPRGWLAAVTRRLALDRSRSEGARRSRERSVARREGTCEDFDVVERGARQRRVAEAVMALDEPYRTTILYRYLDGLTTRAMAERMGVSEATARKRLERGLEHLRRRLDHEFGSRSRAWALALLEPGLRRALQRGAVGMGLNSVSAAGGVVLLCGLTWVLGAHFGLQEAAAVGGTDVAVPFDMAGAREREEAAVEGSMENQREAVVASPTPGPGATTPLLRGRVFVDGERRSPEGLEILAEFEANRREAAAMLPGGGSWSLDASSDELLRLWVTSPATVPAQIPVPSELARRGGVLDLHLETGHALEFLFLDRETREPLADLDFEFSSGIELERSLGRVLTRTHESIHRTDGEGRATVAGVAFQGVASVRIASGKYERLLQMRGSPPVRCQVPAARMWSEWFKEESAREGEQTLAPLEYTILAQRPLGEATTHGQIPAWAGLASEVSVIVRELTGDPRLSADRYLLPTDASGDFELRASAPSRHSVWLERAGGGAPLSAASEVSFLVPGPQEPISFASLVGVRTTLRFLHVPARGEIDAAVVRASSSWRTETLRCEGKPIVHEVALAPGDQIQVMLRLGARGSKASWTRLLNPGDAAEIAIDLAGSERRVRIECPEQGALSGEAGLAFLRCEDGRPSLDQTVSLLCQDGRGISPIHMPSGRWLFHYVAGEQPGIWGVVDVTSAQEPGTELVLRPRLRRTLPGELGSGIRFDEIEGIALAELPEFSRELRVAAEGPLLVPVDARYVLLEEAR